jgi:hypothetical protein
MAKTQAESLALLRLSGFLALKNGEHPQPVCLICSRSSRINLFNRMSSRRSLKKLAPIRCEPNP